LLGDDDILGADLLLGDDDIVGADMLDQILGGDSIVLGGGGSARAKAMARAVAARQAKLLHQREPRGVQTQALPFARTLVTAGTTATILARPQRTFRTERFVVDSTIAAFFTIEELTIGRESMFVESGSIPAQVFAEVGVGVRLAGYTANLGNEITIKVSNIDAADHTFGAAIIGSAVINP
jgi:hypothetical protein